MESSLSGEEAGRRAGYLIAAAGIVGIWFVVNVWPGWHAVGFLSATFADVVTIVNVSLLVGALAKLAYAVVGTAWLPPAGGLVTSGIGLAVLVQLWRVFPFAFRDGSAWNGVTRTVLVIAMVGTVIDLFVQGGTLVRSLLGPSVAQRARDDARR